MKPVVAAAIGVSTMAIAWLSGSHWAGVLVVGMLASAGAWWVGRSESVGARVTVSLATTNETELANLRALLNGLADGVWITTPDGTVLQHNRALTALFFTSQSMVGKRPIELVRHAALHDAVELACQRQTATELDVAVEGVRPRLLSVSVIPLGARGSMAVFRDVTELRRLEKVRKDFVANVSHELRTPITAIRGYAETLVAGALKDTANAPRMVEVIHRQSERLTELVDDLLELSRIEANEFSLKQEPLDVSVVGKAALETVRHKATTKKLRIDNQVPAGFVTRGDQRALEQVLVNLLDNAVKHTPEGGQVQLSGTLLDDTRFELQVRDTGTGMEAKHLDRIFERFYRVDKGRARDDGGTGLGLSIVKHLVTAMNGDVRVESTAGQGTTFFVVLPRTAP